MAIVPVKDASDNTVNIEVPDLGRAAAADSIPYALSTEDKAALDLVSTKLDAVTAAVGAIPAGGDATAARQDLAIAQETATNTILGAAADAASATTTIKAALRGIATALGITALDTGTGTGGSRTLRWFHDTAQWVGGAGAVSSATQRVTLPSDDPAVAALGATSGAKVITDANGTIQQYLRGLVSLWIGGLAAGSAIIGKVGIDQTTPGTTDRVSVGDTTVIDVTLSLDTSAYASGDVLADTQVVTNAMRVNDFGGILQNIVVIDKDDQGAAFDIYLLDANVVMGAENGAPSISDANAANILCKIPVATGDYYDLGGAKIADMNNLARAVKPAAGTRNLYIAVVNGSGTPTYTASGVVLRLGFGRD